MNPFEQELLNAGKDLGDECRRTLEYVKSKKLTVKQGLDNMNEVINAMDHYAKIHPNHAMLVEPNRNVAIQVRDAIAQLDN